jgi:pimeloyl-ACP methyl ester carboxylesterase
MILALTLAMACTTSSDDDVVDSPGVEPEWMAPDGGVITVETRDGVTLEADYLPSATQGPAIVLLHMIPPGNTRADWPDSFQEALGAQGWSVMAVDRRGAGGSGGEAVDAYQGEAGKYDVEACVKKLVEDGYTQVAIIGASNGTTSMVDYAVWAEGEGLPVPLGLAYMSGGGYTETQNQMEDVPKVPMAFLYPPNEADWPEGQQSLDPGTWVWHSYADGQHGTRLFDTPDAAQVETDLLAFTDSLLP